MPRLITNKQRVGCSNGGRPGLHLGRCDRPRAARSIKRHSHRRGHCHRGPHHRLPPRSLRPARASRRGCANASSSTSRAAMRGCSPTLPERSLEALCLRTAAGEAARVAGACLARRNSGPGHGWGRESADIPPSARLCMPLKRHHRAQWERRRGSARGRRAGREGHRRQVRRLSRPPCRARWW
jgi:hypothetical protein